MVKKVEAEVKQLVFKVTTPGIVSQSEFIFLICKMGMKRVLAPQIIESIR